MPMVFGKRCLVCSLVSEGGLLATAGAGIDAHATAATTPATATSPITASAAPEAPSACTD